MFFSLKNEGPFTLAPATTLFTLSFLPSIALTLKHLQSLLRTLKMFIRNTLKLTRAFSSASDRKHRRVTIMGGGFGGIGKDLATLIKTHTRISRLSLFDIPEDIGSTPTRAVIQRYDGNHQLEKALKGSDIVILLGVPKKSGMTSDDHFFMNGSIVKSHCEAISKHCPEALVLISNHVNSTVPIAAKVFENAGTYDPKRLLGVTTLDVFRATTFYAEKASIPHEGVRVPVVGGQAVTALPLFSQATPQATLAIEDIKFLTSRVRGGGTEVVGAKATKYMAFATSLFADACINGLNGVPDVVECSYVQSEVTELPFFASQVRLGKNGVEETVGLGSLSDYEKELLEKLLPELKQSINKGIEFVKNA